MGLHTSSPQDDNGSNQQQQQQQQQQQGRTTRGVYFVKPFNKWQIQLRVDKQTRSFGYFESQQEAERHRDMLVLRFWGATHPKYPLLHPASAYDPDKVQQLPSLDSFKQLWAERQNAHTSSQYLGVHWNTQLKKWQARVSAGGSQRHVGYFDSEEEAARARDLRAVQLLGDTADLNFPQDSEHYKHQAAAMGEQPVYKRHGRRSTYRGVLFNQRQEKWHARMYLEGRFHHVGCFDSEEAAARAYDLEAVRLKGDKARLNFSKDDVPEEDQFGRLAYLQQCQLLGVSPVSQVLKFLESEEMHITHYGLGQKGTLALVGALQLNQSITILRLTHNNIPDAALRVLVDCLLDNKSVTELDLSGNRAGPAGCKSLAALLALRTSCMRTLALSHMQMEDKEAVPICQALENNGTLRSLDLSHNGLGDRASHALGYSLGINIVLQELNLSWNKLRPKGVAAIAEGLKPNLSLQVLGLAWCGSGDLGATALGAALKTNHGLVDVDLCGNSITVPGVLDLAAGISASPSLGAVALDNNDVREEGAHALLQAVQTNQGLVLLRMDNTNCSTEVRAAVEALLAPRLANQRARQLVL